MNLYEQYKQMMETGRMPTPGLCEFLPKIYSESLQLLRPQWEEIIRLERDGQSGLFWASGIPNRDTETTYSFTPLRQTIVLLICAMHGEI